MGKRVGIITVDIEEYLYKEITKRAGKQNLSIRKFVNKIIEKNFEKEDFLKLIVPKISLLSIEQDGFILRDDVAKKSRLAEVKIRNGKLWCDLDEKNVCDHIHYVLMLPDIVNFKDKLKQI